MCCLSLSSVLLNTRYGHTYGRWLLRVWMELEFLSAPEALLSQKLREEFSVDWVQFDFSHFCWNENEIHKFQEAFTSSEIPNFYDTCL